MRNHSSLEISYFGKLPSHGDFIKAAENNHQLIARLDQWAGDTLEALARDVAWKQLYDLGQPVAFTLMGSKSNIVVSGHLLPSQDTSGRRFPFISASSFEVAKPVEFMAHSPLALSLLNNRLNQIGSELLESHDPQSLLKDLVSNQIKINLDSKKLNHTFSQFLEEQTLGSLQKLLDSSQQTVCVRRIFIALGVLLQPIISAGSAGVGKGIVLPLPEAESMLQHQVASLWMDLISGFLGKADFRVLMLQRQTGPALLAIGFNGLATQHLQAMFDPNQLESDFIPLYDPDWADEHIHSDQHLNKLATYTEHQELSLSTARDTFHATFLGV